MSSLFDYKRELSALRFTEDQKKALAASASSAARQGTAKRRRPVFRTALIAAVMAAVLVVGAGASGVLRSAVETFAPTLGGSTAQTEVIDKIGHPIGASATDNGLTVTADAIIGDQYNVCIIYTVSRDDGTVFDYEANEWGYLGLSFREGWIDIKNAHGGRENVGYHGMSGFIDQVPGDNAIQYIQQISSDTPLNTGVAAVDFKNLEDMNYETGKSETIAAGRWKLRFDMDYEDSAVYLANGETFSQDDITFTIDEISISPIAVRVAYTADKAAVWSDSPSGRQSEEDARESARFMENVEILLTKTDGTVIDLSDTGGTISPDSDKDVSHCTKNDILDEIIPLEDMASISVGGVVYEIPHN